MALPQDQPDPHSDPHFLLMDSLFCEEEKWIEEDEHQEHQEQQEHNGKGVLEDEFSAMNNENPKTPSPLPRVFSQQDLFWEEEELASLLAREKTTHAYSQHHLGLVDRRDVVEWMLKVNAHFGFSPLTAILSVDYLDRFFSSFKFQSDKPWSIQLVGVACLSLAAKVEETQVPLLLDLQVEEAQYVFEAKTIQRMELLVLSTLKWKMNPVTPLSFVDHVTRRLGLKNNLHWDLFTRSEALLLSIVSDVRFLRYLPSVLATSTMLLVIDLFAPCNPAEYQNQLMGILKINKDQVNECYQLILESILRYNGNKKPKFQSIPSSPNGVIDVSFSCDSSNDSWAMNSPVSSSPEPVFKKRRVQEQQMRLPSFNRVYMHVLRTPP